jgi:hypothetical protein
VAVRGAAALEGLRRADAAYGCGGDDTGSSGSGTHAATVVT